MSSIPTPAYVLGLAGVLPFALCVVLLMGVSPLEQAFVWRGLQSYAALILSFLGAVHWGAAIIRDENEARLYSSLSLSVVPCLVAWVVLSIEPKPAVSLVVLMLAFAGQYAVDRRAVGTGMLPSWYGRLRALLTGLVVALLAVALLRSLISSAL